MNDTRNDDGHLEPNATRFPDGISGLADKIHDMGLKIGIYQCKLLVWECVQNLTLAGAGTETCGRYPGSLEHEESDAADFAAWGIDCMPTNTWSLYLLT